MIELMLNNTDKSDVHEFWNKASCGEAILMTGEDASSSFQNQFKKRYELEPYILDFARFEQYEGKRVLEIGVGLGADHQMFAESKADLYGIDLTERAIRHTKERFRIFGLESKLMVGDAEALAFPDDFFDLVYSWGVIHHSPDTEKALSEVFRVLKPGGTAKIMVYHKYSLVGFYLWIRYALFSLKPFTSLESIYSRYLESPGTKAYSKKEAHQLFSDFTNVALRIELSHGDLLSELAGQRHSGLILRLARKLVWRSVLRKYFKNRGLFLLIEGQKPEK